MNDLLNTNSSNYNTAVKNFLELVSRMRTAQKEYFSTRSRSALIQSKELERKVDLRLLDFAEQQSADRVRQRICGTVNF
jgi:hypothetical protein